MLARTKGRVPYYIRSIFLSTNNKSVMLQIFTRTVRKNKSIILRNGVLPNSPENVFLRPLSFLWKNHFILL